jgi:hypothetical protein
MWSGIRYSAGMMILTTVFVLSHGLLLVHELAAPRPRDGGASR